MANSDGDILNKLEEAPDGDFLSYRRIRSKKKSGEPYKNSPVMGTQDFFIIWAGMQEKGG
ncbi:MAG: hypothetical protein ACLVIY_13245 [Anaerobutyricum soehngenii]